MTTGADHLADEIVRTMHRFRMEYELNFAEVIGVLELIKADLLDEAKDIDLDEYFDDGDIDGFEIE